MFTLSKQKTTARKTSAQNEQLWTRVYWGVAAFIFIGCYGFHYYVLSGMGMLQYMGQFIYLSFAMLGAYLVTGKIVAVADGKNYMNMTIMGSVVAAIVFYFRDYVMNGGA